MQDQAWDPHDPRRAAQAASARRRQAWRTYAVFGALLLASIVTAPLVGADGATHAGAYDFAYLRCIPNLVVMAPADENECRQMLFTATQCSGPAAVRYPRGSGPGVEIRKDLTRLPIGKAEPDAAQKADAAH